MASELVRPLGFEPRTCGLRVRCSAIELEARSISGLNLVVKTKRPGRLNSKTLKELLASLTKLDGVAKGT